MNFHGEVSSADAHLGVAFGLYLEGEVAAHTLLPGEVVIMTDYSLSPAVAIRAAICAGTDEAGKRPVDRNMAATGGPDRELGTPYAFPRGVAPVLFADAGAIRATIHGRIVIR